MKKENNAIVVTTIIAGTILVIALLAMFVFVPMVSPVSNTATVQGTSTIKVLPDQVSVHFVIRTNGTTSAQANDANKAIYDNLTQALNAIGFNNSQIGTESFNVYPNTYYENGKQKTEGFVANHVVKLEFSANNTDKLSSVIDSGINAGAGVNYVSFQLSTALESEYKAKAIEEASKDAQNKADALAQGFGKTKGRLVSVSVDNYNYIPFVAYSGSGVASAPEVKAATANIAPTEQDVSATVSATYKF